MSRMFLWNKFFISREKRGIISNLFKYIIVYGNVLEICLPIMVWIKLELVFNKMRFKILEVLWVLWNKSSEITISPLLCCRGNINDNGSLAYKLKDTVKVGGYLMKRAGKHETHYNLS